MLLPSEAPWRRAKLSSLSCRLTAASESLSELIEGITVLGQKY